MLLRAIARGSRAVSATPKFAARTQVLATLSRGCCSDHAHNHFPARSLRPQDPAPEFTAAAVIGGEIKKISTADFKGKYWVLCFYPLDFTFVCPTEIIALSDRASDFKALDCNVAVISVDSAFSHLAWVNTPRKAGGLGKMEIPVIADLDKSISEQYGVLLPGGMALRGTFIVDGKGTVRSMSVNDLPVGRSVDEILRTVKAFQHVDKHGEVCPAGWDTGKDTMIADPEKSKAYFKKQKD